MKKIFVVFGLILLFSCEKNYLIYDEASENIYSVIGYVSKNSATVQVIKNLDYGITHDLKGDFSVRDLKVEVLDSVSGQVWLLPFSEDEKSYIIDFDEELTNSVFSINIYGKDLEASSTNVNIPVSPEFKNITINDLGKGVIQLGTNFEWSPKNETDAIEMAIFDKDGDKLILQPNDFEEITQCYNKRTFTTIYKQNCYLRDSTINISNNVRLFLNANGSERVPLDKLVLASVSKEMVQFIESINFITDFEKAFINTGLIRSNIQSANCTGYFYGRAEVEILVN